MSAKKSQRKQIKTEVFTPTKSNDGRAITVREEDSLDFSRMAVTIIPLQQLRLLWSRTPAHAIRQREGPRGRVLDYIPHGYVESVLNQALGGDWDFEIISDAFNGMPYELHEATIEPAAPKGVKVTTPPPPIIRRYLTVLGRLRVRIRTPKTLEVITELTKTEFGSAMWDLSIEKGDALKAASSDAFKRCGVRLGIGADLYYDDESARMEYQSHLDIIEKSQREAEEQSVREREEQKTKLQDINTPPENVPALFVKASQLLGLTPDAICATIDIPPMAKGGVTALDMLFSAGRGAEVWKKLIAHSEDL